MMKKKTLPVLTMIKEICWRIFLLNFIQCNQDKWKVAQAGCNNYSYDDDDDDRDSKDDDCDDQDEDESDKGDDAEEDHVSESATAVQSNAQVPQLAMFWHYLIIEFISSTSLWYEGADDDTDFDEEGDDEADTDHDKYVYDELMLICRVWWWGWW